MSAPHASVIVLTWNGKDYIQECLTAVLAQEHVDFEVLVVDNGSSDGTPDLVAEQFPQVRLIRNERNLGFAGGNNVGLRVATSDLLVLLNQDTRVHTGWLAAVAATVEDSAVGIVGCKLLYPEGTIQHAGGFLYGPRGESGHIGRHAPDDGEFDELADVEFVTAAALAIRRTTVERIGLLDEGFSPAYYEDIDWCYRARAAGFRVVYQPRAVVTHYESATAQPTSYRHKLALNNGRVRFLLKHWPLARLLSEFGPAEKAWLVGMARSVELMAARRAYFNAILGLPGILAFRSSSTEEAEALLDLLLDLRAAALTSLEALLKAAAPAAASPSPESPASSAHDQASPSESPAPSSPLVRLRARLGRLWAGLRYLDVLPDLVPQVQQQQEFIGWLSRRLDEHDTILEGQVHDVAENIRELTALAERLAQLEKLLVDPEGKRQP